MPQDVATCNALRRIIVSRDQGDDVLLGHMGDQYRVPRFQPPNGERFVAALTSWGSRCWDCDLLYLFSDNVMGATNPITIPYSVLEVVHGSCIQYGGYDWTSANYLSTADFCDPDELVLVAEALERWKHYRDAAPGLFAHPGWWRELSPQITAAIRVHGHTVERLQQLNGGPNFTLLRIDTSGPVFWFKAVGEPNMREFPITLALMNHLPTNVPRLVQAFAEWNGWLAADAEGVNLNDAEPARWAAAFSALAQVQIASLEHRPRLRQAGARDLSLATLEGGIQSTLEELGSAMRQQTKPFPLPLTYRELDELGAQLQTTLAEARTLGIPDTLVHLDLNPGNVIVSSSTCTFLDWSEAYIGYPFCSCEYLAEQLHRFGKLRGNLIESPERGYWSHWQAVLPFDTIAQARRLVPLIAVFAYSVALLLNDKPNAGTHDRRKAYLRSLARRMKREADRILDRRLECNLS